MGSRATWTGALVLALGGLSWAGEDVRASDDDLALVKKAVGAPSVVAVAQAAPPAPADQEAAAKLPAPTTAARHAERKEPAWFKVRVVEKGSKKARVTVNLPLALVRALGEDLPVHLGGSCRIRISDVLKALDSGQDLVQVDDEEATVRVWVE